MVSHTHLEEISSVLVCWGYCRLSGSQVYRVYSSEFSLFDYHASPQSDYLYDACKPAFWRYSLFWSGLTTARILLAWKLGLSDSPADCRQKRKWEAIWTRSWVTWVGTGSFPFLFIHTLKEEAFLCSGLFVSCCQPLNFSALCARLYLSFHHSFNQKDKVTHEEWSGFLFWGDQHQISLKRKRCPWNQLLVNPLLIFCSMACMFRCFVGNLGMWARKRVSILTVSPISVSSSTT